MNVSTFWLLFGLFCAAFVGFNLGIIAVRTWDIAYVNAFITIPGLVAIVIVGVATVVIAR